MYGTQSPSITGLDIRCRFALAKIKVRMDIHDEDAFDDYLQIIHGSAFEQGRQDWQAGRENPPIMFNDHEDLLDGWVDGYIFARDTAFEKNLN